MSWMYCVTLDEDRVGELARRASRARASTPKIGPSRKPMPPMNDQPTTRIDVKLVNSEP